ncbi:MAG: rod shape determining protein RodA, partial [Thermoproteota archaeon]
MVDIRVSNFFKKYDFIFFGLMFVIFVMGVLNLYSANHANSSMHMRSLYKTQIIYFTVSAAIGFFISFLISPKNMFRFSYFIYISNLILLVLVLLLGKKGMGAQRWLVVGPIRLQPSELMKISLTLVLARWYSKTSPEKELTLKQLIIPGLLTLVPAVLIIAQPDLGTGLLLVLIFLIITFYKRITWKSIGILAVVGFVTGMLMYNFGLKEYQRRRILTFMNPHADARGAGYNAIQSEIAIGSGQFWGKGFKNSTQASLS